MDAANGPGANFTDLPAAVLAASTGDTILVRPGDYSAFGVSGKALVIRGAGSSSTRVSLVAAPGSPFQEASIDAVPAGMTFSISGIHFIAAPPFQSGPVVALRVLGSSSEVVLADVKATSASLSYVNHGLQVLGGATVHADRCTFTGGGSTFVAGDGAYVGPGCRLAADRSTFIGGVGNALFTVAPGGAGLEVVAGQATIARSSAYGGSSNTTGGRGLVAAQGAFARVAGTAADSVIGGSGSGPSTHGAAILVDASSSVTVHGGVVLVQGGPGAPVTSGPVTTGAVPLPQLSMSGVLTPAGELIGTQPVTALFNGWIPNAPFACIVDVVPTYSTSFAPFAIGELLVPPMAPMPLLATLDASASFQVAFTPATIPQLLNVPIYTQFGVFDAMAGQIRLSNLWVQIFN